MVRRLALVIVAVTAMNLSLVPAHGQIDGGAADAQSESEGGERLRADRVRVAIKGAENNITPFTLTFGSNPATNDVIHLVYDSLFWSQVKADPEPWLAESARSNEDGSEWTITLRDGVVWHDGQRFSADDVLFSFEYYELHGGSSGRYAHHVSDVPDFDRGEVIDELTVKLFFNQPAPQFKIMPGADLPIIPRHVWESIDDPATAGDMLPIGTGPFRVESIEPDESYRLVANEEYHLGRPTVDRLDLVVIPDPSAAFAALQEGSVDMVERNVPPELLEQFRGSADIDVAEGTRIESNQLYFNAQKEPLSDPVLRRAIAMSFDLDDLVDTILLGNARPGRDTFLHPASVWAVPEDEHDFDVDAANALLDQAGYPRAAEGELRRAPNGEPLRFSVLVNSFEPSDIRAVQLLGEHAEAIGVELIAQPLEPTALRAARRAPDGGVPEYDAYISGIESHAHVDPDALYYFFHSPGDRGFGAAITGYSNPEFDAIAEEAARATEDDRRELVGQLQSILAEDRPVQVLWYPDGIWAFRPATYAGWVSDPGHGIFTVRSFLPAYVDAAAEERSAERGAPGDGADAGATDEQLALDTAAVGDDSGSNAGALVALAVVAAAVLGGVVLVMSRRNRMAIDEDD